MGAGRDRGRSDLNAGAETPALSVVIPVYNEGENVVPNLFSRSRDESQVLLKEKGFRLGAIAYRSGGTETVQRQDPPAGTVAEPDSAPVASPAKRTTAAS